MANNTYTVDYAPTAKAGCKFSQCKNKIEKGGLRIGKSFPSDRFTEGGSSNAYYHPECWFEAQKKTKKTTRKVESEDDLDGFDTISDEHKEVILDLLKRRNDPPLHSPKKKAKKTDGGGGGGKSGGGGGTPKKQSNKQVYIDSDEEKYNNNNKPKSNASNNSSNNVSKPKRIISESDGEESEDLEKDAWAAVASNGSRVAKVLNSVSNNCPKTDIKQVSVIILASASKDAIKRVSGQDDRAFADEFGGDPDAYLQWLAGTGVLWVSTDFEDAGFTTPGLWSDTSSQIVRQIFMQKPKKGVVVAMWGPETKHFKSEIKKHYQDAMGTIKYRALDGPSPLSSSFNSKDELSKIDDARTLLSMHALHWWPFEGEVALKKEASKNSLLGGKKKSSDVGEGEKLVWVLESHEEEGDKAGIKVLLTNSPVELGRSLVNNKKISRTQCVVEPVEDGIELTPLGVNPMTMSRRGSEDVEILGRNEKYTLHEGDSFTLCGEQYRFVIQRLVETTQKDGGKSAKSTPRPTKQPSKIDESEKTKRLDAMEDEEHANGDENDVPVKNEGEGASPDKKVTKQKSSEDTTTATTTSSSAKKSPHGSSENESATVPFSAGYDSPEEGKAKAKKKPQDVKMEEPEEADDEALARKLQEELNKESKAKPAQVKTPKSKNNTPNKDEEIARKLQEKFNNESGKKKRKQDDEDDGEVNWAAKVKKKKVKKGGSDEDDDWARASVEDDDSDGDYEEENDSDAKSKKKPSPKKPPCKYGKGCYRTNPDHFKDYSHPK